MQFFQNLNVAQRKIMLLNIILQAILILVMAGESFGLSYWVSFPVMLIAGVAIAIWMGLLLNQSKVLEAAKKRESLS